MQAKVLEFSSYKEKEVKESTSTGEAICVSCKHKWQAVSPVGVEWLECPKCHLMKGKFLYGGERQDKLHWNCSCGNDLFFITPDGAYCPNCGIWQTGYEI